MPLNTSTVAPKDSRRTAVRPDPVWLSVLGDLPALRGDLPASWFASTTAADCRSESRIGCDRPARLTPVDEPLSNDQGAVVPVVVTDISRHGIGISHAEPLPYRLVQIEFDVDDPTAPVLLVRLQWCRFRKPGLCESGGQIQWLISREAGIAAEP